MLNKTINKDMSSLFLDDKEDYIEQDALNLDFKQLLLNYDLITKFNDFNKILILDKNLKLQTEMNKYINSHNLDYHIYYSKAKKRNENNKESGILDIFNCFNKFYTIFDDVQTDETYTEDDYLKLNEFSINLLPVDISNNYDSYNILQVDVSNTSRYKLVKKIDTNITNGDENVKYSFNKSGIDKFFKLFNVDDIKFKMKYYEKEINEINKRKWFYGLYLLLVKLLWEIDLDREINISDNIDIFFKTNYKIYNELFKFKKTNTLDVFTINTDGVENDGIIDCIINVIYRIIVNKAHELKLNKDTISTHLKKFTVNFITLGDVQKGNLFLKKSIQKIMKKHKLNTKQFLLYDEESKFYQMNKDRRRDDK